jgi:hypothetical protein
MNRLALTLSAALLVVAGSCDGGPPEPVVTEFTVGPEGKTISFENGAVTLTFPAGALSELVTFSAAPISAPAGTTPIEGTTYELSPSMNFLNPVQVTIRYSQLPQGVRSSEVAIYKLASSGPQKQGLQTSDAITKTVTASVMSFSTYAILAEAVGSVVITPSSAAVTVGSTVQLTAMPRSAAGEDLPDRPVSWETSNATIAGVSSSGLVTGAAAGSASITATSGGKAGTSQVTVSAAGADPAFLDNFDIGSRRLPQNGYQWNGSTPTVTVSNALAYSGSHSLRFDYGPDAETAADDSDAEQRFQLGAYLTEVWFEYMLYVPSNYFHRALLNLSDTWNNKFFTIWRDDYQGLSDWRIRVEIEPNAANGQSPSSSLNRPSIGTTRARPVSTTSASGGSLDVPTPQVSGVPDFIGPAAPIKPGQWNQIRIHLKAASALNAKNGVLEIWSNGLIAYRKTDGDFIGTAGTRELHNGYLMGWANSGFTSLTTFYIDDFKIFPTNPNWP